MFTHMLIVFIAGVARKQRHASCDKSIQAFPPLFLLQATKAGHRGLGTRLRHSTSSGVSDDSGVHGVVDDCQPKMIAIMIPVI